MSTQILLWALGVLATILGGLNIMQLLTFQAYKRQRNAEADRAEIESLSEIIKQNQAEIGRLNQRIVNMETREIEQNNRYNTLQDKYYKLRDELEEYKQKHK